MNNVFFYDHPFVIPTYIQEVVLQLIPVVLSLTVHEYAHAQAALLLGDPTAKEKGHLTLNPKAHIDPLGTLFIPALSVLSGGGAFLAWARPAPFRVERVRAPIHPRLASAAVALAGPLANLLMALIAIAAIQLAGRLHWIEYPSLSVPLAPRGEGVLAFLSSLFTLNLALTFFNLLPIPPLDGAKLLPPFLDRFQRMLRPYGFGILLAFFFCAPKLATLVFYQPIESIEVHLLSWLGL
ncbi:site-2 protease family protein [Pajaroellobacter abortibovis]|uniref:Peptidase M50 domain-containing protein n=1 Tax=Pajaroellobacter abortibovis TaxID=1882918 RepID=A0A1L6MXY7_9BACT|nr:site-2 protease family protein [Pajaroellobacter abortibovis]APS00463.1 hypothetical protein BCY86_07075 [Pajaroellobacter abortibovis]